MPAIGERVPGMAGRIVERKAVLAVGERAGRFARRAERRPQGVMGLQQAIGVAVTFGDAEQPPGDLERLSILTASVVDEPQRPERVEETSAVTEA